MACFPKWWHMRYNNRLHKNPKRASEALHADAHRGLMATWPLPTVRDKRYFTWHTDEEVRTQLPEPLACGSCIL